MAEGGPAPRPAHGVALSRAGETIARQRRAPGWERDDDAAIAVAVAALQRHRTMDELVAASFDGAGDDWVGTLCRLPGGRVLNVGVVEDAASWRRPRELPGARPGRRLARGRVGPFRDVEVAPVQPAALQAAPEGLRGVGQQHVMPGAAAGAGRAPSLRRPLADGQPDLGREGAIPVGPALRSGRRPVAVPVRGRWLLHRRHGLLADRRRRARAIPRQCTGADGVAARVGRRS
jgi:hypothetical protein